MKKITLLLAFMGLFVFGAFAQKDLKVDVKKSTMVWVGKKVTGEHTGNLSIKQGTLKTDGTKLTGGNFTIDMNSITCTDITDAKSNSGLVGHLKNDDFFGVAKFPTANFKITNVSPIAGAAAGAPNYNITGDLTIKGVTQSISFPAVVTVNKKEATAKADVKIDRTKFGIKYGSGSFIDNLGDKAIDNEFLLKLDVKTGK